MSMEPLESSAKGISSSDSLSLEGPVVLARPRVAAFREFPEGCGRRFAVLEHSMSSDSTELLGTKKTLVSENTTPEKNLNEGEPFNTIKTMEPAVRRTIREPYPSQRRDAFHEFPPGCARFAPKINDKERLRFDASSKRRSLGNNSEETAKGYAKRVEGNVHKDPKHVRGKNGRGDVYDGRGRIVSMVSGLEAKRSTEGPSRVGKGKGKVHDLHDDPTDLVKKKDRGNPELVMSSDSTESIGTQKTTPEKVLNEGESLNPIKTMELGVRKTVREPYPSQRRAAFCEFPPGCGRFAPKINDKRHLKLDASSKSRSPRNKSEEIAKGYAKRVDGKVHKDPKHVLGRNGRGDETPSKVGKGKEKVQDLNEPLNQIKTMEPAVREAIHELYPSQRRAALVEKKGRGDAHGGRGVSGESSKNERPTGIHSFAKGPTATPSRVVIGKGKEKELDMHCSPTNLVMKKDTGDAYESPAYGGRGRTNNQVNKDVARSKVRVAIHLFQAAFKILLRGKEAKSKEEHGSTRIDMSAYNILKKSKQFVNTQPILGPVPGIEVGDEFRYCAELFIVGLHYDLQRGITYLTENGIDLATSVVARGEIDNMDSPDVIIYTGEGGNPTKGKKQAADQKLEHGNLALKNSFDKKSPVRVIRAFTEKTISNKTITRYIYDGIYLVEYYQKEKGCHGTNVFKFHMKRVPGQRKLDLKEVQQSRLKRVGLAGLCDISHGKEKIAVTALNTINKELPPSIRYLTKKKFPSWYNPTPPKGCQCVDGCLDSTKCSCAIKNGGKIPFNCNGDIVCVNQ